MLSLILQKIKFELLFRYILCRLFNSFSHFLFMNSICCTFYPYYNLSHSSKLFYRHQKLFSADKIIILLPRKLRHIMIHLCPVIIRHRRSYIKQRRQQIRLDVINFCRILPQTLHHILHMMLYNKN